MVAATTLYLTTLFDTLPTARNFCNQGCGPCQLDRSAQPIYYLRQKMSLVLLVLLLANLCASQDSSAPDFLLEARRRTSTSNLVQLRCVTDLLQDRASPGAVFFLNGTTLEELSIRVPRSGDGVLLLITREIEGIYSCALQFDPRTSNTIALVGKHLCRGHRSGGSINDAMMHGETREIVQTIIYSTADRYTINVTRVAKMIYGQNRRSSRYRHNNYCGERGEGGCLWRI